MQTGAVRVDLAGEPAGIVTPEAAAAAVESLARHRAAERGAAEQKRTAPPQAVAERTEIPATGRLGLAGLRAAAAARKNGTVASPDRL